MARETSSDRSCSTGTADAGSSVGPGKQGVFRREGEYWTVGYVGNAFRLKDTRGLGYVAHLLRHPAVEFHVLDLFGGIASWREDDESNRSVQRLPRGAEDLESAGIHITALGDAGEMLDDQAKAAYRRRLSELREELEGAKELGNVERAEQAEREIDALTRELSRAVGLGGRNRRAASASERARQTITHSIKSVLERIAQSDAQLADILSRCIKTGTFCSYQPDLDFPIAWEFAATTTAPAEPSIAGGDSASVQASLSQTSPVVLQVSPFSLAERTEFVGRETERASIRAVIDRALNGHGAVVMLEGGPGAGKTRLAMEMAEYASRVGFRYVVGHCYERDEPFPFLPFVEILESGLAHAASLVDLRRRLGDNAAELAQIAPSLRRAFPDIPQPPELPPSQKRRYLFQGLSEALAFAARTRSYFFVLEDLHWADESTLALLNHLANRVAQLPVVIIGTYRDSYSENNPALTRTLEELIRLGIRPLKLSGLSKEAIAQMLQGLSKRETPENLVSLVFDQTQGNPFFVEELYRHLLEEGKLFDAAGQFHHDIKVEEIDVPENVRLVIGRRLRRLDENERHPLAAAGVIGRSFSFQLLTAISQIDVDELFTVIEKAQQMGVIVPSSEGPERPYAFGHELVRQTLLAGIAAPRQQQLHARVADAIELVYPGSVNERAGEVANHLIKAGPFADEQRLVRSLTLAGNSALDAAAFEEACTSFQTALSKQAAIGAKERAELLARLAIAESGLQRWDAALANLGEVVEIFINLGDREMVGKSFSQLTDALILAGRFPQAARAARRGLVYLEGEVSVARVRILDGLSQALAWGEGYEPAHEALKEAMELASQLADPKLVARLVGVRSILNYHFFRLREAVDDGFQSEQMGGPDAPPWQRAVQLRVLYPALVYLGRTQDAARVANELEPLSAKIGQWFPIAMCRSMTAWIDFGQEPDLARLEVSLRQALKSDDTEHFGFWAVSCESQLSLVDFY